MVPKGLETFYDERLKACFRISREIFKILLNHVEHNFKHKKMAEERVASKERLTVCLDRLSRRDYHYTFVGMTDHELSTIQNITNKACSVIVSNF